MKIKKEITKKKKTVVKKKVTSKVRTVASVKKTTPAGRQVAKKTKTASAPKRVRKLASKKSKTIAASKKTDSIARRNRIFAYRAKRLIYMILSVSLGALISGFVLGLIEMIYLKNVFRAGAIPETHQFLGMNLFLEPTFFVLIFALGVAFGIWLGFWGWRVVYIEKRHRVFRKK